MSYQGALYLKSGVLMKKVLLKLKSFLPIDVGESAKLTLKDNSVSFCPQINKWWPQCSRTRKKFEKDHAAWLSGTITVNLNKRPDISQGEPATSLGRPQKPFEDLCKKSKIRRVAPLVNN